MLAAIAFALALFLAAWALRHRNPDALGCAVGIDLAILGAGLQTLLQGLAVAKSLTPSRATT